VLDADKTKLMIAGNMGASQTITAEGKQIEEVEDFCYLGSVIAIIAAAIGT